MRIEIWSDVMCPWCYIGKHHFETAIRELDFRDGLQIVWRSYQLRPGQSRTPGMTLAEGMSRRFNMPPEAVAKRFAYIRSMGEEHGLEIKLDTIRPVSSYDAHRLLHMAAGHGLRGQLLERLFASYLRDNENIADPAVLARLAGEAGLDGAETQVVLNGDAFGPEVLADQERGHALGVSSVPTFVVAGKYAFPGARPLEEMRAVLRQAWMENGSIKGAATTLPDASCAN